MGDNESDLTAIPVWQLIAFRQALWAVPSAFLLGIVFSGV